MDERYCSLLRIYSSQILQRHVEGCTVGAFVVKEFDQLHWGIRRAYSLSLLQMCSPILNEDWSIGNAYVSRGKELFMKKNGGSR